MSHASCSRRSRWLLSTIGFILPALVVGCTTGQIGGEIDHSDDPNEGDHVSGDQCVEVTSTSLQVDEPTELGISAQDLIDAISGVHEMTLAWGEDVAAQNFELTPAAGDSTITIEVTPRPESAVLVDLELDQSDREDDRTLVDEPGGDACTDEVRVTADVIITSENGAFDDSFEATFSTKTGSVATGRIEIVPGELEGDFATASDAMGEPVQTAISLSFAFGMLSGNISGIWQEVHGEPGDAGGAVSASPTVYGRFPADGCERGVLIDEGSPWGDAILDAIDEARTFDLSWQAGNTTALSVDTGVGKLCLEANAYEVSATIVGDAVSNVASEDGRIDSQWDVEVRAWIEDDEITSLSVTSVQGEYQGHDAEEFAMATGIGGVETDATDLAFEFTYSVGLGGESTSGTLTVFEMIVPECSRPDYEPEIVESPDGGSSGPGCMGIDYVELETATFVESSSE